MDDSLYFSEQHHHVREMVRDFSRTHIAPVAAELDRTSTFPWENIKAMGELGLLGVPWGEELGGAGMDQLSYYITIHEMAKVDASHALTISAHTNLGTSPIVEFGTEEQKRRYVPLLASGQVLGGFGLTEPGAGSDAGSTATTAVDRGDHYVINGSKIFISNGQIADLFVVVVKTDPKANPPHRGVSLILVEADAPGFVRGRKLDKLGFRGQDTSELFFEDCRVPVTNLLGGEGGGFKMLMEKLQQERICIAVTAVASCRRALADTVDYVKQRHAFGQPIAAFQNTQFKLAELATQVEVGQAFVDRLLAAHVRGEDVVMEASMAKWWTTDLQKRVTTDCLQLHGGYGFMLEYPISTDFADAAVQSIYAGSNEIMKVIIARRMGLG